MACRWRGQDSKLNPASQSSDLHADRKFRESEKLSRCEVPEQVLDSVQNVVACVELQARSQRERFRPRGIGEKGLRLFECSS